MSPSQIRLHAKHLGAPLLGDEMCSAMRQVLNVARYGGASVVEHAAAAVSEDHFSGDSVPLRPPRGLSGTQLRR